MVQRGVKIILLVIAISLFVLNYDICDYFYYNEEVKDLNKWWGLKSNIYALILALVFQSYSIDSKGLLRFFLQIGTGFTLSNLVDKVYFNVVEFQANDVIMIIMVFIFSFIDYYFSILFGEKYKDKLINIFAFLWSLTLHYKNITIWRAKAIYYKR